MQPNLHRLEECLAVLAEQPSAEPGTWPPEPLSAPAVPRLRVPPVRAADDLTEAGVVALAAGISEGEVSASAVVEQLIARAEQIDGSLHAWALLDGERARAAAAQRDAELRRGERRGPLHGVPIGIKDIFDVAGLPTRANSAVRRDVPPAYDDAACVAVLRSAGALILGKAATTEFAMADPSAARNPWNPAHTPGGSSSGSAAGVAARLMPGALGSQTAGSVLRPAAFCGVAGFKPSAERISRQGVIPLAWSLDHVGTLTRSAADAAALYATMTGAAEQEIAIGAPRIGLAHEFLQEHTDEATRGALQTTATHLERAGATVEPLDLQQFGAVAGVVQQVIMWAEVAAYHLGAHPDRLAQLGPRLRATVQSGALLPAQALMRAQGLRRLLFQRWNRVLRDYDAVIVPAAPGTAPEGLEFTGNPALNGPWTLLGVPAISIPIAVAENGLPLGMQLVAPYGEDARLLAVADWCEKVVGFKAKPPL